MSDPAPDDEELAELELACRRIFADYCTPQRLAELDGQLDRELWAVLEETGFTRLGIEEQAGGSGGGMRAAITMLRVAGYFSACIPLAETSMLAGWLLAAAGAPWPDGIVTAGADPLRLDSDGPATGSLLRVPYGRQADSLVVLGNGLRSVAVVPTAAFNLRPGHNLAGEPRDDITINCPVEQISYYPIDTDLYEELELRGALARAALLSGAVDRTLRLSVRYATERNQFGRPIGAFQAVQQQAALLAGESAAAATACMAAARVAERAGLASDAGRMAVAAAKVRSGIAASRAAAIAHQVHAAIGVTYEHHLRFSTTRLWSWSGEWGTQAQWSSRLGAQVIRAGAEDGWRLMAGA